MNSRKIVHMFFQTLLIGWIVGFATSLIVQHGEYAKVLSPFNGKDLLGVVLFFSGYALVFTVVAQTGFFAYLFIHRYGQSFFRSFWPTVQLLIIAFVLFDIVYFTSKELSLAFRIGLMLTVLLAGLIVSYFKMRQTNRAAFIPALFVMVVILTLELSLVLRAADKAFILLMLTTLFAANAYQLLILHHVTKVDPEHQRRLEERRKQRLALQKQQQKEQAKKQKEEKGKSKDTDKGMNKKDEKSKRRKKNKRK